MKTMVWPSSLRQFVQHGLQALLEFAAELGAGQQRRHVERQHALALERLGHLARDDALRQAFDDGGLAHAGLADQHRVVLGAALQHLDGAADFLVAADHRVELAQAGALGQVHAVFLQGFALAFGIGAVHALAAAHRVDGGFERLARQAVLAASLPMSALLSATASRNSSPAMNWSLRLMASFSVGLQQLAQLGADLDHVVALHLRQLLDRRFGWP